MFYVIKMPVNEDKQGPEMNPENVVEIFWEVWDQNFLVVHEAKDEDEANRVSQSLNDYWKAVNGP